ncbi:MAG: OmpA family protein, partial [Bacteroidia bacterium]|nr:OmpA family protein [Bacteroidia bacterium]
SHPRIRIDIHGHTDDIGDDEVNMILSENRARSVLEALVRNGINEKRLTYKGFGETKPVASNETVKGRMENRRTEFVIIDK